MVGSRLTTWRSAANAPERIQNLLMMVGAFVCCNGLLDGCPALPTESNCSQDTPHILQTTVRARESFDDYPVGAIRHPCGFQHWLIVYVRIPACNTPGLHAHKAVAYVIPVHGIARDFKTMDARLPLLITKH
jgi:hypothetical protein